MDYNRLCQCAQHTVSILMASCISALQIFWLLSSFCLYIEKASNDDKFKVPGMRFNKEWGLRLSRLIILLLSAAFLELSLRV